jgi:hypothetical protein
VIKNPNEIVEKLTADYLRVFEDELTSVVLFGSATTHEFKPGVSQIETLLILQNTSIKNIHNIIPALDRWIHQGVAVPLCITSDFLMSSLDCYSIEILDIQSCYRVLYGEDPVKSIVLEKSYVRLQCERELKSLAIELRYAYINSGFKKRELEYTMDRSIRKLLPLFKAILVLHDRPIPNSTSELISSLEDLLGLGVSVFSDVYCGCRPSKDMYLEFFDKFAATVDVLINCIDLLDQEQAGSKIGSDLPTLRK